MTHSVDIIVPTWNNPEYLNPCVHSILRSGALGGFAHLWIVNNGKQDIAGDIGTSDSITILEPGENLGWEGGLKYALERTSAPYVCFQNDDTFIPQNAAHFYQRLLLPLVNPKVAAVGPVTTTAAGIQSIYHPASPMTITEVPFLIFFTVMVDRFKLEAVGGVDDALCGGDDFDLSIRFRKSGFKLVVDPSVFLIHHGFKTGTRVRGDHTMDGGWNSPQMTDRTNQGLIRKHGFASFIETYHTQPAPMSKPTGPQDSEGDCIRSAMNGATAILELGCGGQKTVEKAIGVDRIPKGEPIPHVPDYTSVADVIADVSLELPFDDASQDAIIARHVLEHVIDPIATVRRWASKLKVGGKLYVAVPNETITRSIPMNFEHVHAFTPESLRTIMSVCGLAEKGIADPNNGVSFVGIYEKVQP